MERWPSGRRHSPAKGAYAQKRIEGSNPSFSAKKSFENSASVAQLDRVLGYEPRGQEFESLRVHQLMTQIVSLSSRGLGHRPFTAVTRVRISLGTPLFNSGAVAQPVEQRTFNPLVASSNLARSTILKFPKMMKFKPIIALSCCITSAFAYTQSDLLSAQYEYQTSSNQLTLAKQEKQDASAALSKSKQKLDDTQKAYQDAQKELQGVQTRYANAESSLILKNKDFGTANNNLNQIWNSLNK